MPRHDRLRTVAQLAAAAILLDTVAKGLGASGASIGQQLATVFGAVLSGTASLGGNWLTNRWNDAYRRLAAEFNEPERTQRNHFLRRVVAKAIALGIEAAAEDSDRAPNIRRALRTLARDASDSFESGGGHVLALKLEEHELDRYFIGTLADLERVPVPSQAEWATFLEYAVGSKHDVFTEKAIEVASLQLESRFRSLLRGTSALASEFDPTAYAALQLALIRSLSTNLAKHAAAMEEHFATQRTDLENVRAQLAQVQAVLADTPRLVTQAITDGTIHSSPELAAELASLNQSLPRALKAIDASLAHIRSLLLAIASGVDLTLEGISTLHSKVDTLVRQSVPPHRLTNNLAFAGATLNHAFVGRTSELDVLASLVEDPRGPGAVAIVGGAAVGKTELAKAFVNSRLVRKETDARAWDGCWWIDASHESELVSLTRLIPTLTGAPVPPPPEMKDPARQNERQREWLILLRRLVAEACSNGRHFLVLDDVEDIEQIRHYQPTPPSRLIVTTRRRPIPPATARELTLGALAPAESRLVLTARRPDLQSDHSSASLDPLANHLGHHPLALAYAAAWLARPPFRTPESLLTRLTASDLASDADPLAEVSDDEIGGDYRLPLAASLVLLLDELPSQDGSSADALPLRLAEILAFCGPHNVPMDLLRRASAASDDAMHRALFELHRRSLATVGDAVSMHSVTQSLLRARLRHRDPARVSGVLQTLTNAVGSIFRQDSDDHFRDLRTLTCPHAEVIIRRSLPSAAVAETRVLIALHLVTIGAFRSALDHFDAALLFHETPAGAANQTMADMWQMRAAARHALGDHQGALADITLAMAWADSQEPVQQDSLLRYRQIRALIRLHLEDDMGAAEDLAFVLDYPERQETGDLSNASLRSIRAELRRRAKDFQGALEDVTFALSAFKKDAPADERLISVLLLDRARILRDNGDSKGAIDDVSRAMELANRQVPLDHWGLIVLHFERASLFRAQRDLLRALEDITFVIDTIERQKLTSQSLYPTALGLRAIVRSEADSDLDKAVQDATLALAFVTRQSGDDQPAAAADLYLVRAQTHVAMGATKEALADLLLSREHAGQHGERSKVEIGAWHATLAEIHMLEEDWDGALADISVALSGADATVPDAFLASWRAKRAKIRHAKGDLEGALDDINASIVWMEQQVSRNERALSKWLALRDQLGSS